MAKGRSSASRRRPPHTRRKHHGALTGTLKVVRPGAGEVITAEGTFPLASGGLREGMNGDTVGVTVSAGRDGHKLARVQTVIERATSSFLGIYQPLDPLGVVTPLDERIRRDFFVLPDDLSAERLGVAGNDVVVARILEYPKRGEAGVVTLEERVGAPEEIDVAIESVIARHSLPVAFPARAQEEASCVVADTQGALAEPGTRDLRDQLLVTVDPATARDFDDAVFARKTPKGYELTVAIADVTRYVGWGSSMDVEARKRTCSVYLADRVLPMLPEELSCDVCSLRPGEDRCAMAVVMELDRQGALLGAQPAKAVICSAARFSYDQVDAFLDQGASPQDLAGVVRPDSQEQVAQSLVTLDELAAKRRALRHQRGSIDFASSESKVELDEAGTPIGVTVRTATRAPSLIEEAMLCANEAVAAILSAARVPAAFRVHEPPSPDDLAKVVPILAEFDLVDSLQAQAVAAGNPFAIEGVLERAAGTPYELLVSTLLLRAQKKAIYLPRNDGHYALGATAYCHFTSPIRRYPDVVVHRALKAWMSHQTQSREMRQQDKLLPQLCRDCSEGERTAAAAEYESQRIKMAELYSERIGAIETGIVSGCERYGLFVRLSATGAEGLLPVRALGDQWFTYDEKHLQLVGEDDGRLWRLGQPVAVQVSGVDVERGRIDFALAPQPKENHR